MSACSADRWSVAIQLQCERQSAQKLLAEQKHHFIHQLRHGIGLAALGLFAAVAQHGPDNFLALLDCALDCGAALGFFLGRHILAAQEVVSHANDRQEVVEIVGDAGSQRAEGLHFLAVKQFGMGQFQFASALAGEQIDLLIIAHHPLLISHGVNACANGHQHTKACEQVKDAARAICGRLSGACCAARCSVVVAIAWKNISWGGGVYVRCCAWGRAHSVHDCTRLAWVFDRPFQAEGGELPPCFGQVP